MKFISILLLSVHFLMAQTTLDGIPYTKLHKINNNLDKVILESVQLEILLNEDENREPGTPFRYGYIHEVEFNITNSGKWIELEDGSRIWQIHFKSRIGINLNIK